MKRTAVTFVRALLESETLNAPDPRKRITMGSVSAFVLAVVLFSPIAAQAVRWEEFKKEACVDIGKRRYSSRLMDIPWGQSWEDTCNRTPADVMGTHFNKPTECKKDLLSTGIWGQFDVPDPSCTPRWGSFQKDRCTAIGVRRYSSRLWDIPPGVSWEDACKNMPAPATINGIPISGKKPCEKDALSTGIWGQFDVPDASCPHWGSFTKQCVQQNVRYYSAILEDIPPGVPWVQTCQNFPADVPAATGVKHFDRPTQCSQLTGVVGTFVVDEPCDPKTETGATASWNCPPRPSCPTGKSLSCEMLASGSPTAKGGFPACDEKGWYCCGGINKDPNRCPAVNPSESGNWYPPGCD